MVVVDDDPTSLLLLTTLLEAEGFAVYSARNARECVSIIQVVKPSLLLLDVMLPDISGFALCTMLKKLPGFHSVPVIFITALGDADDIVKGLSIGGVDYITKPFLAKTVVLARVRLQLSLRNQNRALVETQRARLAALRQAHESLVTDVRALPDARCAVFFQPAQESGGDQYDVVCLSDSTYGYFVADIAGHGIEESFKAIVLKTLFRENAHRTSSPVQTFYGINALMKEFLTDGQHVSAAYVLVDRRESSLTLLSAGHLPILLDQPQGTVELLRAEGDLIGVFDHPFFEVKTIRIEKGTRFWVFTDGMVEDFKEHQSWSSGIAKLMREVRKTRHLDLQDALSLVSKQCSRGGLVEDDRLLLVGEL